MKFTVYIQPIAKARARTVTRNGKVHSYTPSKTVTAEWFIRNGFTDHYPVAGILFPSGPVVLDITCYLVRPKSAPKSRLYPIGRPDADNYLKLVQDALEGYAYENDSQIVTATVAKRYGTPPRIEINIEEETET